MLNFAETAQTSFEAGPEGIRKYAKVFAIITNVAICIVHYHGILIYILYVATSFQQVRLCDLQRCHDGAAIYHRMFFKGSFRILYYRLQFNDRFSSARLKPRSKGETSRCEISFIFIASLLLIN
jgi:hypothetical protein